MSTMIIRAGNLGPPNGYVEIGDNFAGMTNLDHSIQDGIEDRLRTEKVWTRYAGWDFNGRVFLDAEGSFSCQVWVYGSPVATVRAHTLKGIMEAVSNEWGWD